MTPSSPQPQPFGQPLSQGLLSIQTTPASMATVALPRFNASYAVMFVVDGAKKRRELAYSRARDLQRELGVAPAIQCVPSLP